MKENKNLQTSTIRVQKKTLDSIKIYCRKHGRTLGEWADFTWNFIEKNDFDVFDDESTPALMIQEQPNVENISSLCSRMVDFVDAQREETAQVAALCKLVSNMANMTNAPQLPNLDRVAEMATERANAEAKVRELEEKIKRLEAEKNSLEDYKERAYKELCRVRDEQKLIGKIEVKTEP